jgi:hypothetical protein
MDLESKLLGLLSDLDITASLYVSPCGGYRAVMIDRTAMVNFQPSLLENDAYEAVLRFIRGEFPDYSVYWSNRTDDYLGVEFRLKKV